MVTRLLREQYGNPALPPAAALEEIAGAQREAQPKGRLRSWVERLVGRWRS